MSSPSPSAAELERSALDRPVRARVHRARSALAVARGSEAALVGAGTVALVLAAVVLSGGTSSRSESWALAVGTGLLAAASWWLELRPRAARVARRIDVELGLGGALVTAYEAELAGARGPLVAELSRRVAARVPLRAALRAALPPTAALAGALALAAVAVLALAQQQRPADEAGPGAIAGVALAEIGDLAGLHDAAEVPLSPEERAELAALATRAKRLALERGQEVPPRARELLEATAAELAELGRRLPAGAEALRRRLERAEAATDAALAALPVLPAPEPGAPPAIEAKPGAGRPEVASGAGSGTMLAPDPAPGPPEEAPVTDPPRSQAHAGGLSGGRWWSARDELLVERWVEARRAAARASDG